MCSIVSGATSSLSLCIHEIETLLLRCTVIPHHASLGAREELVTSNVRVVATKIAFEAKTSALFLCFRLCHLNLWCLYLREAGICHLRWSTTPHWFALPLVNFLEI